MVAYDQTKHLHLAHTVRAISAGERRLIRRIAELSREQTEPPTPGAVYAAVKNDMRIGYTAFFKRSRKFDALRLVNLIRIQSGGGTNEIVLRYERELVREVCG